MSNKNLPTTTTGNGAVFKNVSKSLNITNKILTNIVLFQISNKKAKSYNLAFLSISITLQLVQRPNKI